MVFGSLPCKGLHAEPSSAVGWKLTRENKMAKCAHSLHLRFLIDVHIWSLALSHVNEIRNIGSTVGWKLQYVLDGIVCHFIRFHQHQMVHGVRTHYFWCLSVESCFMVVSESHVVPAALYVEHCPVEESQTRQSYDPTQPTVKQSPI